MSETFMITGASRGIGLAIAQELLLRNASVRKLILLARESASFDESLSYLEGMNERRVEIRPYRVDLSDRSATIDAVHAVHSENGNVDVLVNNAGYTNPVAFQQVEFEGFEQTMMVNVYAPFTLTQELLHMGNRFDTILNIASTAGITGRAGWLTYSASKAALINMSAVLREELSIYGTRVVCLSPGRCATDLRRTLAPDEDPTTIMQPENVASVVQVLLSETGSYLDSANLVVRK